MQRDRYPPDAPREPMSEDCLSLNIWAPAGAHRLPVMVWIYGGGLEDGSASTPLYSGESLARKGVVVVTFNYRVGVFGFLALPELTRESPNKSSGNYGFLDQIAALQWVKRNIAGFGGDADRVTVFGQSSGSISISILTASPLARRLFARAIGESGGLFEPVEIAPDYSLSGAEDAGERFLRAAHALSVAQLRALPAARLLAVPFAPHAVIDHYLLDDSPYDIYRAGRQNPVALLIGTNSREGEFFLAGRKIDVSSYTEELGKDFPRWLVDLLAPSPGATAASARAAAAEFEGDMRFRWDMWTWARLAAQAGNPPVFLYEFARAPPWRPDSPLAGLGATHGVEMYYVFGHLDPASAAWTGRDRSLSDLVQSYWTNFAKAGNPNAGRLPQWPAFAAGRSTLMVLQAGAHPAQVPDIGRLERIGDVYAAARIVVGHLFLCGVLAFTFLSMLAILGAGVFWRRRSRRSAR